jgi:hypothetical protein
MPRRQPTAWLRSHGPNSDHLHFREQFITVHSLLPTVADSLSDHYSLGYQRSRGPSDCLPHRVLSNSLSSLLDAYSEIAGSELIPLHSIRICSFFHATSLRTCTIPSSLNSSTIVAPSYTFLLIMTIHLKNRLLTDLPLPSVIGVTNAVTVGTDAATQTSLAIDSSVTPFSPASMTGPAAPGLTAPPPPSPPPSPSTEGNTAKSIPMSTVLAVCIGAFITVSLIVVLAVWIYKRTGKHTPRSRNHNHQLYQTRNARGDIDRSRSRQERWGRLEDDSNEPETHYPPSQTREAEKDYFTSFSMFKKSSPSVRSIGSYANTTAESRIEFDPEAFATYHPQLGGDFSAELPTRDFFGRIEAVSPMSWGTETIGKESHLSSSSGANAVKAIPTPPATSHGQPHRWESAEVEHFYEDNDNDNDNNGSRSGRARSSFESRRGRRRTSESPFFGGGTRDIVHSPSRSGSHSHSRSHSRTLSEKITTHNTSNPFSDPDSPVPELPRPRSRNDRSTGGSFNSERALLSLIAALTPDDEQDTPNVQAMRPSVLSMISDDMDRTSVSAFPLPPKSLPP